MAKKLVELSKQKCRLVAEDVDISGLREDQRVAFEFCKNENLFVITGSPGTGKSHLLRSLLDMYNKYHCLLMAPTGMASHRMSELTGRPASTIHKSLLPIRNELTGKFEFSINKDDPFNCDLIAIDENSMLSIDIAYHLFSAIPKDCKVILSGDFHQLPSVGPGNFLRDLIDSKVIPVVELTEIKRQDKVGLIIKNCSRIKNGEDIIRDNSKDSDMFLINIREEEKIVEEIVGLVSGRLKKIYPDLSLKDYQILACHNEKTLCSVENMNNALQQALNSNSPYIFKSKMRRFDKCMNVRNNYTYDPPLLNGSVGIIQDGTEELDKDGKMTQYFIVKFFDRDENVLIPVLENDLRLSFSCTTWKFQGNESKVIIIPIVSGYVPMLAQRNWLYTSISRGKSMVIIVGHISEIKRVIDRTWAAQRNTYLSERLRKYEKEYCILQ